MEHITVRTYEDEPPVPSSRIRRRPVRRRAALAGLLLLCVSPAQTVDAAEPHDVHHAYTGRSLYVSDYGNNRVLRLRPNDTQTTLNPTGLNTPTGLSFPPRTGADG
ncbi:hypothetical protein ACIGFK_03455 [Streptomyces sp. NPDC085524]|uniref:hypothetical protein n=1 Tax=Streptomyces sp. NPDC085524 TaxID=3365728 RepID=UPI0037D9399B